jgi:hypothetical protein
MYFVYKLYSNDDLIYVGKTNDTHIRISNHLSQQPWSEKISHIEFAKCNSKIDMDIYELYYINKLKPKYNKASVSKDSPTFNIDALNFKRFSLHDFFNLNKSAANRNNESISIFDRRRSELDELLKNSIEIKHGEKVDLFQNFTSWYHWCDPDLRALQFMRICDNEVTYNFLKEILMKIKIGNYELRGDSYCFEYINRKDMCDNYPKYQLT